MPLSSDQLAEYAAKVFPRLDRLSYFDLLGVDPSASMQEVRTSFYRIAAELHPDRYQSFQNRELKEHLESIYARICEGYRVLTQPERRSAYARALSEGKFRLVSTERESNSPQNPEDSIKHEEAKKFFRLATICIGRKDWKGAMLNLNFARSFEPQHPLILQKLSEVQSAIGKPGPPK